MAPCSSNAVRNCLRETSAASRNPSRAANTATAPAACPVAMQVACTRNAEFAKRSPAMHLPAARMFCLPRGIIADKGMVGTTPAASSSFRTPSFVCKSIW